MKEEEINTDTPNVTRVEHSATNKKIKNVNEGMGEQVVEQSTNADVDETQNSCQRHTNASIEDVDPTIDDNSTFQQDLTSKFEQDVVSTNFSTNENICGEKGSSNIIPPGNSNDIVKNAVVKDHGSECSNTVPAQHEIIPLANDDIRAMSSTKKDNVQSKTCKVKGNHNSKISRDKAIAPNMKKVKFVVSSRDRCQKATTRGKENMSKATSVLKSKQIGYCNSNTSNQRDHMDGNNCHSPQKLQYAHPTTKKRQNIPSDIDTSFVFTTNDIQLKTKRRSIHQEKHSKCPKKPKNHLTQNGRMGSLNQCLIPSSLREETMDQTIQVDQFGILQNIVLHDKNTFPSTRNKSRFDEWQSNFVQFLSLPVRLDLGGGTKKSQNNNLKEKSHKKDDENDKYMSQFQVLYDTDQNKDLEGWILKQCQAYQENEHAKHRNKPHHSGILSEHDSTFLIYETPSKSRCPESSHEYHFTHSPSTKRSGNPSILISPELAFQRDRCHALGDQALSNVNDSYGSNTVPQYGFQRIMEDRDNEQFNDLQNRFRFNLLQLIGVDLNMKTKKETEKRK